MSQLNIFITGATGYIGGTVLSRLLSHPHAAKFSIIALVRSEEKASKLRPLGVKTITGSYTDSDLSFLTDAAAAADVTIATANADNLPAARAILDGIKVRFEKTGKKPALIHTSGIAFLADDANGLHGDQVATSDLDSDTLEAIPSTAVHRNVDTLLVDADKQGYVLSYIITPSVVYGYPSGVVTDNEAHNLRSIVVDAYINAALDRPDKQAGYFGNGLNQWSFVDINDTADLYTLLFDSIINNPGQAGHGREGYYFVESFTYKTVDLARVIAKSLFDLGVTTTQEPKGFTAEEQEKLFGGYWKIFAGNCVAKADRSRALGWKDKSEEEGRAQLFENVKAETAKFVRSQV